MSFLKTSCKLLKIVPQKLNTNHSRRKNSSRKNNSAVEVQQLEERKLLSRISFVFNYKYDRYNFFNSSAKRAALTLAGKMLTENIYDGLQSIIPSGRNTWRPKITDPGTGNYRTLSSQTRVNTDKIIVYVGSRSRSSSNLATAYKGRWSATGSTSWLRRVRARGESGALRSSPTDFGPWGGSITFNKNKKWHFGKTAIGLDSNEYDFVSVAMHELGHILGIASHNRSWTRLIDSNRRFRGSKSVAEYGSRIPIHSSRGHFDAGVINQGREVSMDPNINRGVRKFFTKLDFTALDDIGWSISTNNDTIYRAKNVLTRNAGDTTSTRITGSISNTKDVDIFRVYVVKNTDIDVRAFRRAGTTTVDTFLRLYNASGSRILSRDQGGRGGTDSFTYKTNRNGYFYIAVSSYRNRNYKPLVDNSGSPGTTGGYLMDINLRYNSGISQPLSTGSATQSLTAINSKNSGENLPTPESYVVQTTSTSANLESGSSHNTSATSDNLVAVVSSPQVAPESNLPDELIDHLFAGTLKNPLLLVS